MCHPILHLPFQSAFCSLWHESFESQLWTVSDEIKLSIPYQTEDPDLNEAADSLLLTNTIFCSYLIYDLMHVLYVYPALGRLDTGMLHAFSMALMVHVLQLLTM